LKANFLSPLHQPKSIKIARSCESQAKLDGFDA
jgi:hypothetical protein